MNQKQPITTAVILAAGRGTRMKSKYPKAMQLLGGRPLLAHLLENVSKIFDRIVVVCGPDMDDVKELASPFPVVIQRIPLGTADAARLAQEYFGQGDVAILYADTPLISTQTMENLLRLRREKDAGLVLLSMRPEEPGSYGRIVLNGEKVEKIVEWQDATEEEKEIELCNAGGMCGNGRELAQWLNKVDNKNAKGEYYLTDIVAIAREEDRDVYALEAPETELIGINSRYDLATAEANLQDILIESAMQNGVTFVAPETVFLSADTELEEDVVVEPHVVFGPRVYVQQNTRIKAFSYLEGCNIGENAQIGPFARIRPESYIGENTKIGNFVEVKNSYLAQDVKASHLSYVGDTSCGERTNIGAGTVICNYDGHKKHHTTIGRDVFIGSNSVLVSPLTLDSDAFIAAGSTITKNVPSRTLAFGRARQVNRTRKME